MPRRAHAPTEPRPPGAVYRIAVACLALVAGGWPAQAQPVSLPQLQVLAREQRDAERAYDHLSATQPAPSERLVRLRLEVDAVTAAIAQNYALRDAYATGRIAAPAGEADVDAWRARVSGVISNTVAAQERTLREATRELARLEREELAQPLDDARARFVASTTALDDALQRFAAAQGPLTVASVAVLDGSGARRFVGSWRWTGGAEVERRVVEVLEAALAGVRADIGALRPQNLQLAEDLHDATRAWNAALTMVLARAESRAFRDLVVQTLQNTVEIGFAFATAGTWTAARVVFLVADVALRAPASFRLGDGVTAAAADAERDNVGAAMREAIAARIADDLVTGRPLDPQRLLDGREALPTTPSGATPSGSVSFEAAKSAVAALIAYVETGSDRARPIRADRASAAIVALTRGVPAADVLGAAVAVRAEREALAAATSQLRGFGVSLASMAGGAAVTYVADLFVTYRAPTDAELARRMAYGELRIFLLSEAYRQSRALYDARIALERALLAELPAARQRLAAAGGRAFVDGAEVAIDRGASVPLAASTGPLAVRVEVEAARVPWRVEVWHVAGDRSELLASARAPAGAPSATTPPIPVERLPAAVPSGPPTSLLVRVLSEVPGDQDADGDPATPARVEAGSLAWVGWEAGPDAYRFHLAAVPFCGSVGIAEQGTLCRCSGAAATGSVWGTDLYTSDSAVCSAALHAGALEVIPVEGGIGDGVVEVRRARGCGAYEGTTANGVTTLPWGAWSESIYFPAVQAGLCEEWNPPPAEAWYCPATGEGLAGATRCQCSSLATRVGSVWGTAVYTSDSSVCRAALHAGAVGPGGGTIEVVPLPGREGYEGESRNGVDSYGYGRWGGSFGFR